MEPRRVPKYNCSPGDPLAMLMEECGEVIQAGCKMIRFKEHHEGMKTPEARRLHLIQEMADVVVCMDRCIDEGLLTFEELHEGIDRKHARLKELFGYVPK